MAKTKKRRPFDDFEGVYMHSSEFPESATAEIPPRLLTAIDEGNEEFFAELKGSLPEFYSALVNHCSPVRLLETVTTSISVASFGQEQRTYQWGLDCGETLIVCAIPFGPVDLVQHSLKEDYLPCLPQLLYGCYVKMDGMTIPDLLYPPGTDLPAGISDWRMLSDYCLDHDVPHSATDKLHKKFGNDDIRVYIEGSRGDLILLDYTKKRPELYHVKDHEFEDFRLIDDPQILDHYFANAILGFPEKIQIA